MTREEREKTIDLLDNLIGMIEDNQSNDYDLALKTAIKSLKQEPILNKMRDEVIDRYPKNYASEPELGGSACEFSLNQILQIIDKYRAEMEREE